MSWLETLFLADVLSSDKKTAQKKIRVFVWVFIAIIAIFIVVSLYFNYHLMSGGSKEQNELSNQIALEWVRYLKNENKLKEMPKVTWELCDEFDSFLADKMNNMEKDKEYDYLNVIRKAYADYKSIPTKYPAISVDKKTCEYFTDNATELDKELNYTESEKVRNPYYFFLHNNGTLPLRFEPLSSKCL